MRSGGCRMRPKTRAMAAMGKNQVAHVVNRVAKLGDMKHSDEIDYRIHGDDLQTVEVELDPQETVIAEAGAMNWMEEDIAFETRMGDGSEANQRRCWASCSAQADALLTGESVFMTHFTNRGAMKRKVAFAGPVSRQDCARGPGGPGRRPVVPERRFSVRGDGHLSEHGL